MKILQYIACIVILIYYKVYCLQLADPQPEFEEVIGSEASSDLTYETKIYSIDDGTEEP